MPVLTAALLSHHMVMFSINLLTGTAFADRREIVVSDGDFAVLASMALHPQLASRDEWCDRLWPDRDGDCAARLLKVYVHRIRAKFGSNDIIETHARGYRLGRSVSVDVDLLDALARGFGDDCAVDPAQVGTLRAAFAAIRERRYRRIATLARYAEYERRFIACGVELARMLVHEAFRCGDDAGAQRVADDVMLLDPYDDVAIELVMRVHVRLGRLDAASRHFRAFCRTLRDELDLPPPRHLSLLLC